MLFSSKLRVTMIQRSQRKHSVCVRDYQRQRDYQRSTASIGRCCPTCQEVVETSLPIYLRVNMHDFEDLCNLTEAAISKRQTKFR